MQTDKQLMEELISFIEMNKETIGGTSVFIIEKAKSLLSQPIQEGTVLYRMVGLKKVMTVNDMPNFFIEKYVNDKWQNRCYVEPITLTAMIKEVASKAFMAGCDFSFAADYGPVPNPCPDKETYINNL